MWWKKENEQDPFEVVINHILRLEESLAVNTELLISDMSAVFRRLTDIEGKINKLLNRRVRFKKGKTNAVAKNLSNL